MAKDKLLLEKIKKQINKAKVVSFDIFDTLLVRPYIHPIDLFEHMEKAYERPGFAAERKDAERRTRIRHKELEDITFDMIYDEIDEEFKDMKQKEMDWEEMVLRANPELKQVYDYALAQGKRVIITSDMYLPTEFLAKVLRKNGFDNWDKLYVSGDISKKKGTGSLYSQLIKDIEEKANNILHIGDNKKSDAEVAQKLGFKTVLYEQVALQFLATHQAIRVFRKQTMGQLDSSILVAIFAYRWQQERCGVVAKSNYWQNLGFKYAGPIAYGYTRYIKNIAEENKYNNILFVARDGYTLQRIFNSLTSDIRNSYVYAPRFLNLICTLDYDDKHIFDCPCIVEYYSLKNAKFNEIVSEANLTTNNDYDLFIKQHIDLLSNFSAKEMKRYRNYINHFVNENDNILSVDSITASFSSQNLIQKALNKNITGIYWAVNPSVGLKYPPHSYCFAETFKTKIKSRDDNTIFTKNWNFMEFLFSSPEYPIQGISEDKKPIYKNNPDEYEILRAKIYPSISDAAVDFALEVKDLFKGNNIYLQFEALVKLVNAFVDYPSPQDIEYMQQIQWAWDPKASNYIPLFVGEYSLIDYVLHPLKTKKSIGKQIWKSKFQKFFFYMFFYRKLKDTKSLVLFRTTFNDKICTPTLETRKFF